MTTPTAVRRRERVIIGLLVFTILLLIGTNVRQQLLNDSQDATNDHLTSQTQRNQANAIHACVLGNRKLRHTINRNIVRPLFDALTAASASTVRTRVYAHILHELEPVPYARCHALYPKLGKPKPPFFRPAKLPPPLRISAHPSSLPSPSASLGTQSTPAPATAPTTPTVVPSPPSSPSGGGGSTSPPTTSGGGGGGHPSPGPPGPPGEPGPPGPPAPPSCIVNALGICVPNPLG